MVLLSRGHFSCSVSIKIDRVCWFCWASVTIRAINPDAWVDVLYLIDY